MPGRNSRNGGWTARARIVRTFPIPAILARTWRGWAVSTRNPRSRYRTTRSLARSCSALPSAGSGRAAGWTPRRHAKTICGQRGCPLTRRCPASVAGAWPAAHRRAAARERSGKVAAAHAVRRSPARPRQGTARRRIESSHHAADARPNPLCEPGHLSGSPW
jgi:hypothetical protein